MRRLTALLALLLAAGCGPKGRGPDGPTATLRAYAEALEGGKADAAYELLSDDAKRSISREAFRRLVRDSPSDTADIAKGLSRPGSPPVVTATVIAAGGDRLELVYEDGAWRIDGTGIDRYSHSTPRLAIEGFLRAFDRKRWDVLIRYVPKREREGNPEALWGPRAAPKDGVPTAGDGLTAEKLKAAWTGDQKAYISGIIEAIRSALPTAKIEQTEDRAALPYGAGGTVLFLREDNRWKIEDLK